MTEPSDARPVQPGRQDAERQARLGREAAALRENLHRRKQQARIRQDASPAAADAEPAAAHHRDDCPPG